MKRFACALLVFAFLLGACSSGSTPDGGGASSAAASTTEGAAAAEAETEAVSEEKFTTDTTNIKTSAIVQPADLARPHKDKIVFCQGADLTVFDPHRGSQERAYSFTNHLYDTLFEFDEDYHLIPCLAESYEIVDDGMGLKLSLKEGVKFHDGTDFTAEDAEFSIRRKCEMFQTTSYGEAYKDCTILDDYNLIVNFNDRFPTFVYFLGDPAFAVVPTGHTEEMLTANPVGTGPYKLSTYQVGDYYRAEAFEDYWCGDVYTKEIELRIVPEAAQRAILLETGEIDLAYGVSYNDISRIQDSDKLELLAGPSMKMFILFLNNNAKNCPALGDARVRKALEMALDKEALVQAVTYGYGKAAYSSAPDVSAEWLDYPINQYNLDAAKELMKEAGYENGFDFSVWVDADQMNQEVMAILQDQWKKLNVNFTLETQDINTTLSRYFAGDDYDSLFWFFSCNSGHSSYTLHYTLYSPSTASNYSQFKDEEFDSLVNEWLQTVDEGRKAELVQRLYEIMDEKTPQIPIYNEMKVIGATGKLAGFRFDRIGAHQLQHAVVYTD